MPFVLFAAPYFSENAKRFIEAVARLPEVALGLISQEPLEHLPEALRARIAAHYEVDDALDCGSLVRAAESLSHRMGPIHRFIGVVEQIQIPLAEAREQLGIPGMSVEATRNFRDKARMKTLLRAAGLPCARHRLVTSEADAWQFATEVGYPLIVKPPAGAAAQSTFRVNDSEALRKALIFSAPSARKEVLLEEFIRGSEHSFDTFSLKGRAVFHSLTHYFPTPLEVIENPWIQWCVLLPREIDEAQYDDIRQSAFRALEVLGMETGMSHLEWFRRRDGSLAISEVGARPPGAQIPTLISRANDFDCNYAWARLVVYDKFDDVERRYAVGAAYLRGQGRGQIKAIHGLDQAEREVGHLVVDAKLPQIGESPSSSYEGDGYVILRHPETEIVKQALLRLISLVRVELGG